MNFIQKIIKWYKGLPDKKKYLEFITALLSIPVLITIVLLNITNLNKARNQNPTPAPVVQNGGVTIIPFEIKTSPPAAIEKENGEKISPTPVSCKNELPPVDILSPRDGEIITVDPICIDISYQKGNYCAVVWSYSLNNSLWSEYTDKAICLYNLPSGNKSLSVKVKSIASGDETILKRTFVYTNSNITPAFTPAPTSTGSSILQ